MTVVGIVSITMLATATTLPVTAAGSPNGDYNGDGRADLVLAVPGEDLGGKIDAGALTVVYGDRSGLNRRKSQTISQAGKVKGANEPGDHFGRSFASGDLNGDGRSDLVVGAPNEAVGDIAAAGAVTVLYGSRSGLSKTGTDVVTQRGKVQGVPETGDRFGNALALGDFDGDGYDDVVVGVRGEDAGSIVDSGSINVLYGSASGITRARNKSFSQSGGVAGTDDRDDRFGTALATGDFDGDGYDDIAVGAPGEDIDGEADAGAVTILYGSASGITASNSRAFSQAGSVAGTPQGGDLFGESLASGDFDGDGRDDLAIGVPGENIGRKADTGQVNVLYGSKRGIETNRNRAFSQDGEVNGTPEAGDRFGAAVAAGDFNGDRRDDLAVGVPGENIGARENAGQVNVLYGSKRGLRTGGDFSFSQDGSYKGSAEDHDHLGSSVQAADLNGDGRDDLIAGVPGEDIASAVDAGIANVVYGSARGLRSKGNEAVGQSGAVAGVAERGDGLGLASFQTWLDRVNLYRRQAGLDPVSERSSLSAAAQLHAQYMVRNGVVSHSENRAKPGYTNAGNDSGGQSDVYGTTLWTTTDIAAVDGWITGPFHAVGFLTPNLTEVGFGSYRDANASYIRMAAGLDIWGAPRAWEKTPSKAYAWPGNGSVVPVREHINEWPSPTTHCPGNAGLPVMAFFVKTVNVKDTTFTHDGKAVKHCVFDGTDYSNPDGEAQRLGRAILGGANTVVLMPRDALTPGEEYCFSVASGKEKASACFTVDPNA